jgi:hypothetical protein
VVCDFHLGHDGGAIVGDGDVAIRGDEDLVETSRAEGGLDDGGDGAGGEDVGFDGFDAVRALLPALIADDDEGAALFVFCYLGCASHVSYTYDRVC